MEDKRNPTKPYQNVTIAIKSYPHNTQAYFMELKV